MKNLVKISGGGENQAFLSSLSEASFTRGCNLGFYESYYYVIDVDNMVLHGYIYKDDMGIMNYYDEDTKDYSSTRYVKDMPPTVLIEQLKESFDYTKKSIIGYKTPIELYGSVSAGSIYVKESPDRNWYYVDGGLPTDQRMPKEIVETWEPVYKKILPVICGYDGNIHDGGVTYGCKFFSRQEVENLINTIDKFKLTEPMDVAGHKIKIEQVRAIWNIIK